MGDIYPWLIPTVVVAGSIIATGGTAIWRTSAWVATIAEKLSDVEGKLDSYAGELNGEVHRLTALHETCLGERRGVESEHGQRLSNIEGRLHDE
jgi:hypothetical protein